MIGSVAETVTRTSPVPVTIVKNGMNGYAAESALCPRVPGDAWIGVVLTRLASLGTRRGADLPYTGKAKGLAAV